MKSLGKGIVIDLFCGIGGLSHGLAKEGFNVVAGIDNDPTCRYGYESNNNAKFINKDIADVTCQEINELFDAAGPGVRILVGCAPCQPYSRLNIAQGKPKDMEPLEKFASLVEGVKPDIVLMENVRGLANKKKYPAFKSLLDSVKSNFKSHRKLIVNMADYGIPQNRKRLVVLASRLGEIDLIQSTHKNKKNTVQDVIGEMETLEAGDVSESDPLHKASRLNPLNLLRIRSTPHDGGSATDWDAELLPECYKKESGKTYMRAVYGRMRWNRPSPTITTQFMSLGTGRFGHPEQDRAISIREAALLQTFPMNYIFKAPDDPVVVNRVARHIGNAVPVEFGAVLGKSLRLHIEYHAKRSVQI